MTRSDEAGVAVAASSTNLSLVEHDGTPARTLEEVRAAQPDDPRSYDDDVGDIGEVVVRM
jgi:hypothetical protein